MWFRKAGTAVLSTEISPEEILIDAHNLPSYEAGKVDGKLNRPIDERALYLVSTMVMLVGVATLWKCFSLMVVEGATYAQLSERNRYGESTIIAERGIVYDRNGIELAWNVPLDSRTLAEFDGRTYGTTTGAGHVLGFVRLPGKDKFGVYYRAGIEGASGVEASFDDVLAGAAGVSITENDARMHETGGQVTQDAVPGKPLTLTIDMRLQEELYRAIATRAQEAPFEGGAAVIIDVKTGEVLALTSYPEYDPRALVEGDRAKVASYATDDRTPYLNRALTGQYTPGSIVKPFMALGALNEGIVTPHSTFVSTGALRVLNPYDLGQSSSFTDWKAHGVVNVRRALAVSSNVYFYYVGGGFGNQKGLGIERINTYMHLFGFGVPTGVRLEGESAGSIPSPKWKEETFPEDPVWRIGDTYHTSIGQYGFQVTPLQVARAVAAIANGGLLLTPRIDRGYTPYGAREIAIDQAHFETVRAGMRDAVLGGTAAGLNVPYVAVAAKTGTAEIGVGKEYVHSWVTGFFPYDEPRYAFALLMEKGSRRNLVGATYAMRQFLDRLQVVAPEYLETQ